MHIWGSWITLDFITTNFQNNTYCSDFILQSNVDFSVNEFCCRLQICSKCSNRKLSVIMSKLFSLLRSHLMVKNFQTNISGWSELARKCFITFFHINDLYMHWKFSCNRKTSWAVNCARRRFCRWVSTLLNLNVSENRTIYCFSYLCILRRREATNQLGSINNISIWITSCVCIFGQLFRADNITAEQKVFAQNLNTTF